MRRKSTRIIHMRDARISIVNRSLFFLYCFQQTKLLSKEKVLLSKYYKALDFKHLLDRIRRTSQKYQKNNICTSPNSKIKHTRGVNAKNLLSISDNVGRSLFIFMCFLDIVALFQIKQKISLKY